MSVISGLLKECLSPKKAIYFNKLTVHNAGGRGGFLLPWVWVAPEASACLREHLVIAGRQLCSGWWKRWEG